MFLGFLDDLQRLKLCQRNPTVKALIASEALFDTPKLPAGGESKDENREQRIITVRGSKHP